MASDDSDESWQIVRVVVAALGLTLLVVVLAYGAAENAGNPAFAQWVEALGTLAAFAAASVAAVFATRAFRLEFDRERRYLDRDVRSQAEQVSAWALSPPELWTSNTSTQPIYDITYVAHKGSAVATSEPLPIVAPSPSPQKTLLELDGHFQTQVAGMVMGDPQRPWPMIEIRFRDAAGRRWVRDQFGVLTEDDD